MNTEHVESKFQTGLGDIKYLYQRVIRSQLLVNYVNIIIIASQMFAIPCSLAHAL